MSNTPISPSWLQQIKSSFIGVILGIGLIGLNISLLFWNENQNLETQKALIELQKKVISVSPNPILESNDNTPIHLTGIATTDDSLKEDLLGIDITAINLNRHVEMYQWEEIITTSKQSLISGGEEQVHHFSYQAIWTDLIIDSKVFNKPWEHQNPNQFLIENDNQYAPDVSIGDFQLSETIIKQIGLPERIHLTNENINKLSEKFNGNTKLENNEIYIGENPSSPKIGDTRIYVTAIYPQKISIIGTQQGNTIVPFISHDKKKILIVTNGHKSPRQMIGEELSANDLRAWGIRIICLIVFIAGFNLSLRPIIVVFDFIPLLGSIANLGLGLFSFVLGLSVWGILTATNWIFIRPIYSSIFLILTFAIIAYVIHKKRSASCS